MNKSAKASVSGTFALQNSSELYKAGVKPRRCDQAKVQLTANFQSRNYRMVITDNMVYMYSEADSMSNIDLLLFSLSPLSFVAFVILPAIFGLIF